jgi:tetratricopeptide (TPR) repeat protein
MRETALSAGDVAGQARAWIGLSWIYQVQGQDQASLDGATEAERLLRDRAVPVLLADVLYHKGWALYRLGQIEAAQALAHEGLALSRTAQAQKAEIRHLNLLSVLEYYSLDMYAAAVAHQQQALAIARQIGDRHSEGFLSNNLGDNYLLQGDYGRAAELYRQAAVIASDIGDRDGELAYLSNLAGAEVQLELVDTAIERLTQVLANAPSNWYVLPDTYCFLAQAYLAQGKTEEAENALQMAWCLAEASEQKGNVWHLLGLLAAQSGRPVRPDSAENNRYQARNCFQAALALFTVEKRQRDCACVWRDWGRFELNQGNQKRGEQLWQKARDLFVAIKLPLLVREMDAIRIQIGEQQGDKV